MKFFDQWLRRRRGRKEFMAFFKQALSDGKLSDEEIAEIQRKKIELEISDKEFEEAKATGYALAVAAATGDRKLTEEEERDLEKIRAVLSLPIDAVQHTQADLSRLRLLREIENGNLPTTAASNVVLKKGEVVHWNEAASVIEEKTVSLGYEGRSSGFSFRIAKGVTYRIGASKGTLRKEIRQVPVAWGHFLITSQRLIFTGDKQSFSVNFDKLIDLNLFSDALKFSQTNRQKPRFLLFAASENVDVIGAVLSRVVSQSTE